MGVYGTLFLEPWSEGAGGPWRPAASSSIPHCEKSLQRGYFTEELPSSQDNTRQNKYQGSLLDSCSKEKGKTEVQGSRNKALVVFPEMPKDLPFNSTKYSIPSYF